MGLIGPIFAAVVVLSVIYWKKITDWIRYRYRLSYYVEQFPGPYSIPILGTAWQFKWEITKFTEQLTGWGQYYAKEGYGACRIWIGPQPLVITVRPEWAKEVLESNEVITKGPEYDALLPWLGTGLLISTGNKWRSRRKLLTPAFHFNVLNEFLLVHDDQSKIFLDEIERFADSKEEFDIFPYVKRCALDIICETAMGASVSAQTNHSHPYVRSVQRLNELTFTSQRLPWLQIKPIWYACGYGAEWDRHLDGVLNFTKTVIAERMADADLNGANSSEPRKKAFLDLLLELHQKGELTEEDIREEVDTFMFEGHDTTSASMGWTLWCMAHHQESQKTVCEEVDKVFGKSDRDCTTEDLKQLKYLEKVIKESLRLRPSVPMMTRRAERDIEINGTIVPEGATIVIAPSMIHTNPQVYDNPFDFDPERFNEEETAKRHPYAYIPFSAGPRNCIGQKFALMEEKTVLSWFFRRYSITARIPFAENTPCPEVILKPSIGFPVQIERRV